jgi:hypothetical protein
MSPVFWCWYSHADPDNHAELGNHASLGNHAELDFVQPSSAFFYEGLSAGLNQMDYTREKWDFC